MRFFKFFRGRKKVSSSGLVSDERKSKQDNVHLENEVSVIKERDQTVSKENEGNAMTKGMSEQDLNRSDSSKPTIVGIFHDMENVALPAHSSVETVANITKNLTIALREILSNARDIEIKTFKSYFDSSLISPGLRQALSSQAIETIDVSHLESKDKDAVDKVMMVDACFFYTDHLFQTNNPVEHKVIVLITGDRDFSVMAKRFTHRSVKVIIVLRERKQKVHPSMIHGVHHVLYLSDLIDPSSSPSTAVSQSPPSFTEVETSAAGPKRKPHPKGKKRENPRVSVSDDDIIQVITRHLQAATNQSMLCSQLGIILKKECGIPAMGLVSFLGEFSEFNVEGTNGSERVSFKKITPFKPKVLFKERVVATRKRTSEESIAATRERTSEERIAAVMDILSESTSNWMQLYDLGIALAGRGFPKQKQKVSELIRLYPQDIKLRGEGLNVEAALVHRAHENRAL